MKILMVNKFLHPNGGSETYIFKLGEHLQKCGHKVQYFGMEHEKRCVGNAMNAYTSQMDFYSRSILKKLSYPIRTIYSAEARKKIRMVLDDFQPDIVHLNNFTYHLTPSIILEILCWKKKTGRSCKIVFTAHDSNLICPNHLLRNPNTGQLCALCLKGNFLNCIKGKCIHGNRLKSIIGAMEAYVWNTAKVYRHIDHIVCCSDFIKRKMDTNPLFSQKTIVMHNFVDLVKLKQTEKKDYILYFGRYSEEKGVKTLIHICKEVPEIPFVFAGSGPLQKEVNAVDNIQNVGFQTGEQLARYICEARFSICPSECYENCPFSVMESQIYGTPVLGANIGGIPELILTGESDSEATGMLFESGNVNDLKEKINTMWNNKNLLDKYSNNCQKIQFDTVNEYAQKILLLYQS